VPLNEILIDKHRGTLGSLIAIGDIYVHTSSPRTPTRVADFMSQMMAPYAKAQSPCRTPSIASREIVNRVPLFSEGGVLGMMPHTMATPSEMVAVKTGGFQGK